MSSLKHIIIALVAALLFALPATAFAVSVPSDTDVYTAHLLLSGNTQNGDFATLDTLEQAGSTEFWEQVEGAGTTAQSVHDFLVAHEDAPVALAEQLMVNPKLGSTHSQKIVEGQNELAEGYYLLTGDNKTPALVLVEEGAGTAIHDKTTAPTVKKTVGTIYSPEITYSGRTFGNTGEAIPFKVEGTLPSDYDDFDKYYYAISDTMGPGLAMTDTSSVKVFLSYNGVERDITDKATISLDGNKLSIEFEDLKQVVPNGEWGAHLIADYEAFLVVGKMTTGAASTNLNFAKIIYTRFPGSGVLGETIETRAEVATYGIRIIKADKDSPDRMLAGACFIIERDGKYLTEDGTWGKRDDAAIYKTGGDGAVSVYGVGDGSYKVIEVEAPAGYKAGKDAVVEISSNASDDTEQLALSAKTSGDNSKIANVDSATGIIDLVVYDEKTPDSPQNENANENQPKDSQPTDQAIVHDGKITVPVLGDVSITDLIVGAIALAALIIGIAALARKRSNEK